MKLTRLEWPHPQNIVSLILFVAAIYIGFSVWQGAKRHPELPKTITVTEADIGNLVYYKENDGFETTIKVSEKSPLQIRLTITDDKGKLLLERHMDIEIAERPNRRDTISIFTFMYGWVGEYDAQAAYKDGELVVTINFY